MKSIILALIVSLFLAVPAMACTSTTTPEVGAAAVTITGNAGISMQTMTGKTVSNTVGIYGTTITDTTTKMNFNGVGVGSSAQGSLVAAQYGNSLQVAGNGSFAAKSAGEIGLSKPKCCHCGQSAYVNGDYSTSSVVNVSVR